MELKEVKGSVVVKTHVSLNCTFMELKVAICYKSPCFLAS